MQELIKFYRLLSVPRRLQLGGTLGLMLLGIIAELITIGSVIPFLALASSSQPISMKSNITDWLIIIHDNPLFAASIFLCGSAVSAAILRLALLYSIQEFIAKLGQELAQKVFSRMLRQNYAEYLKQSSSEFQTGIDKIQDLVFGFVQPLMQGVISAIMAICIAILMFYINSLAAAVGTAIILAAYFMMNHLSSRRILSNSRSIASTMTIRTKILQESFSGFRDIILNRSQTAVEKEFQTIDAQYRQAKSENNFLSASPRLVVETAGIVAIVLIAYKLSFEDKNLQAALPVLGALALGAQRLLPMVQSFWSGLSQAMGNSQIFRDVMGLADTGEMGAVATVIPRSIDTSIEFDNVTFRHSTNSFALDGLSLKIHRGEHIGISGPSGSGKSTLVDLILGLLDPDQGEIRLDGQSFDAIRQCSWQASLAHVPQAIFLANDSIAANIAMGAADDKIDIDRMSRAAEAAQMLPFINALGRGFETKVGENGIRISGGQRQRIGIARALYRCPEVLILDEATSALDDETEATIMEKLTSIFSGMVLITVAHRSTTLAYCDRVLVLKKGKLEALKTH